MEDAPALVQGLVMAREETGAAGAELDGDDRGRLGACAGGRRKRSCGARFLLTQSPALSGGGDGGGGGGLPGPRPPAPVKVVLPQLALLEAGD